MNVPGRIITHDNVVVTLPPDTTRRILESNPSYDSGLNAHRVTFTSQQYRNYQNIDRHVDGDIYTHMSHLLDAMIVAKDLQDYIVYHSASNELYNLIYGYYFGYQEEHDPLTLSSIERFIVNHLSSTIVADMLLHIANQIILSMQEHVYPVRVIVVPDSVIYNMLLQIVVFYFSKSHSQKIETANLTVEGLYSIYQELAELYRLIEDDTFHLEILQAVVEAGLYYATVSYLDRYPSLSEETAEDLLSESLASDYANTNINRYLYHEYLNEDVLDSVGADSRDLTINRHDPVVFD